MRQANSVFQMGNLTNLLGLLFIFAITGCSPGTGVQFFQAKNTADIFATRPIGPLATMGVVTLSEPPLLQVGQKTPQGWIFPADAKDRIRKQQAEFEAKLKQEIPHARVIYRYHSVLNGLGLVARSDDFEKINRWTGVVQSAPARLMERPAADVKELSDKVAGAIDSVNFIGAQKIREQLGLTGRGLRIGVIDTGIDYTHKMLGGSGSVDDFKAINPNQPSSFFPTSRVVGGYDFVGSDFDGSSPLDANQIPKPDANPMDEAGHGSHVAGTIAGVGDGTNTYTGVAPEASLYALKVFGKGGATADVAVIAALDYAADPNGDFDLTDQLDVVNLSLGGGYGQPQNLYNEAINNLMKGGTFVVASAGNAGPKDYIVGSPGTADGAFSIAASVDGQDVNWKFKAVKLVTPSNSNWLVKVTESGISTPIDQAGDVRGKLVDIGLADGPLSDDVKVQLKGNVALIMRGKNSFLDKLKLAETHGAVGAIVTNNVAGKPVAMGGEGKVSIPALPVTMDEGDKIRQEMKQGSVLVEFQTPQMIFEKDMIDTITDFSSKGPRSEDNLLKPEIAAPGRNILSAKFGSGDKGARMDGTSMAAPHMAGVVALIKQAHPDLSQEEIRALLMNTAKPLSLKSAMYPLTMQGAGRVQAYEAATAEAVVMPGGVSLGLVQADTPKSLTRTLNVRNLSNTPKNLSISAVAQQGLTISGPDTVQLAPGEKKDLVFTFNVTAGSHPIKPAELNGFIVFANGNDKVASIPVLTVAKRLSQSSVISYNETPQSLNLVLNNAGQGTGVALVFNSLGKDTRKPAPPSYQMWRSRSCDLESAGYRIVNRDGADYLQIAFKLYTPVTTWNICDLSALIDSDGDGQADQEIASMSSTKKAGDEAAPLQYASVLLDAKKARDIRLDFETKLGLGKVETPDYGPAILGGGNMVPFPSSTVAVLEAPLNKLARGPDGQLRLKLAAQNQDSDAVESDDYLGAGLGDWVIVSPDPQAQKIVGVNEIYALQPGQMAPLSLTRGRGPMEVVVYYPGNSLEKRTPDSGDFESDFIP